MRKPKRAEEGKSEAIRRQIALIPPGELGNSKPKRVLDALEKEGWEIDPSLQSTTSRLLSMAKQQRTVEVPHLDPGRHGQLALELAVELVKASGGFDAARAAINSLEQLVNTVPR